MLGYCSPWLSCLALVLCSLDMFESSLWQTSCFLGMFDLWEGKELEDLSEGTSGFEKSLRKRPRS